MESTWAVAAVVTAVVAVATVFSVLKWAAKSLNEWIYEAKLGDRRLALPPGDLGWPLIGNMLGFLRAFKSKNPETFIDGYVSRSLTLSLSSSFLSLSTPYWERTPRYERPPPPTFTCILKIGRFKPLN